MRPLFFTAAFFALVAAERFLVIVGKDGGLTYDPPSVIAKSGDTVAFQFVSKNHTVTQSSFTKPCEHLTEPTLGIDSGYFPVAPNATLFAEWSFTLENDTSPLWFYCAQTRHCQNGMVFSVNPTPDKTVDAFRATAMGTPPNNTTGGSVAPSASGTGAPNPSQGDSGSSQNGALSVTGHRTAIFTALGFVAGFLF